MTSPERQIIADSRTREGAQHHAAELIAPSRSNEPFWATPAENILAVCLHAAATAGDTFDDVRTWLTDQGRVVTEVRARLGDTPAANEMAALERWSTSSAPTAAAIIATARIALDRANPTTPVENR